MTRKLIPLLLGFALGYFLVLLLPVVFAIFLQDWWTRIVGTPIEPDHLDNCNEYRTRDDAEWKERDTDFWDAVLRNIR